jgi:hypothetical protein
MGDDYLNKEKEETQRSNSLVKTAYLNQINFYKTFDDNPHSEGWSLDESVTAN